MMMINTKHNLCLDEEEFEHVKALAWPSLREKNARPKEKEEKKWIDTNSSTCQLAQQGRRSFLFFFLSLPIIFITRPREAEE